MRQRDLALILACAAASACSASAPPAALDGDAGAPAADAGAPADDAPPAFTAEELAALRALAPDALPAPAADASNRFAGDPRAVVFGQRLFFDPGFSGALADGDDDGSAGTLGTKGQTGKVACASCHVPSSGFSDDRSPGKQISLAAGWGRRRAPSLLDVGQAKLLMWDGRHDTLYNQAFGPIESPVEMNSSRLFVAERIFARYRAEYEAIFGAMPPLDDAKRFPQLTAATTGCTPSTVDTTPTCNGKEHGIPGDGAEFDSLSAADKTAVTQVVANMGKALGAYERRLACGAGRFDDWVHGNASALSASEQRGAKLFVGKARCATCHSGPYMSDQAFHNVGLRPAPVAVAFIDADDDGAASGLALAASDPLNVRGAFSDGDDGRLPASIGQEMKGAFRTPTLRCAARRPSFMHTGQLRSLPEVVHFFARGGDLAGYAGKSEIAPLDLNAADEADLVAFLRALEGPGPDKSLLLPP